VCVRICVCVCVRVCERERGGVHVIPLETKVTGILCVCACVVRVCAYLW